ncbi:MAG: L-2-amino-thiazoline-4-carboxylic acid hydrolase [Desulfarculaceae bacterium]|nr:L-2-amino-thiazoline-4-carboxylic acid hydrolase [Desulfarculaceae bacterium]MCF8071185.1 L-2-amino-thiazoline-4-carboxylic acid hydrolase [Desulfarculaceae bacterium]MCF8101212.1 L-2-amino-thiazoline-4-carboxylic acid hydrolase [Desulfarculaceae bacterium]MCF8115239.1 L-2-amino-thiazoline-4-carboxylic acid hydrolase [Desulfarculaceae bacterium]
MANDIQQVNILTRREIEALIAAPIIRAFAEKLGTEEALAILQPVIEDLAHQSGKAAAELVGGDSVGHFVTALEAWSAGDGYQFDVVKQTDDAYEWNVTHCAYADMYARLGMADLGYQLSCARDFAMVEGFNPKMKLERTMTRMEGAPVCDFRLSLQND